MTLLSATPVVVKGVCIDMPEEPKLVDQPTEFCTRCSKVFKPDEEHIEMALWLGNTRKRLGWYDKECAEIRLAAWEGYPND